MESDLLLPLSHAALESFGASAIAPGRMVFSSICGSHLYGFPSKDSDIDLRGTYVAPLRSVVSQREPVETREVNSTIDGVLVESVFHEVAKHFRLLVNGNVYVIEQILSPIGIARSKDFAELQRLAPRFMTRKTVLGHYSGFSASQLSLIRRRPHKDVKLILYAFRVPMTGINALRTRQIEAIPGDKANIVELNKTFKFDFIDQLVDMKIARETVRLAVAVLASTGILRRPRSCVGRSSLRPSPQNCRRRLIRRRSMNSMIYCTRCALPAMRRKRRSEIGRTGLVIICWYHATTCDPEH